ncbi:sugar transport protein 7-like [Lycium barbarum]|uniref:sugar transport protein 7-like n=1 Tax=Lycium barbarum TaxID=112863 RepID=UPI00293E0E37|nr:sugar transport protein 7-like [Lycium barbarum]
MDGFEVKFSRAIYKRAQKATTNNFCSYINFKLLLFTSTMQISAIPSAWVAHALIESWGRKPVLVIGSVLPLVGSATVVWFPNNIVASLGLAIIGCSGAFLNQVIPIICEEINVRDAQKRISRIFNFMVLCGSTIANVVNMAAAHDLLSGWRWSFASCGLLAFPLIPLSIFLSETPRFLIKKGRMDEAKVALGRIRRYGVEAELHDLVGSIEREDKMKWKRLRRSPHLVVNIASQILPRFVCLLGLFRSRGDRIYHLSRQNSNIAISFIIPLVGLYSLLSGPTDWTGASYPEGTTLMGASLEMTTSLFLTLAMNPLILWLLCVMESWIFALLAACALFLVILIWIFLPERPREKDGESSEEDIWRGHWFWKRFLPETATSGVIEV